MRCAYGGIGGSSIGFLRLANKATVAPMTVKITIASTSVVTGKGCPPALPLGSL